MPVSDRLMQTFPRSRAARCAPMLQPRSRNVASTVARSAEECRAMPKYDYDLLTIGAGSGGVRASRMAASYGARVAVAEESSLGGTCVNLGCIPKKLLVYASHFAHDFEDAAAYGWNVGERSFDWRRLIANKDREIARLNGVYRRLLEGSGVAIVNGRATVVSPHEVDVDGRRISARHLLIATGSRPYVPGLPGCDLAVTSDQMFHLDELPRRMVIAGEFAGILHGLGVEVTQLYRGPLFLQGFDDDVRSVLADEMRKAGVNLRFDDGVKRIDRSPDGRFSVSLESGGVLAADLVLYATGRLPNTRGLGLESAGVALEPNGAVAVDEYSRSSVPCIHAIGDVTDHINLTPVAIHEGMAIAA